MVDFFYLFAISFGVTFISIPIIRPIACFVGLVDKPGGRKRHEGEIPLIGGISIFLGLVLCVFFEALPTTVFIRLLIVGSGLMVVVGALDDRLDISAAARLLAQAMIALIFVYGLEIRVSSLGQFGGVDIILPHFFSVLVSMFAVMAVTNAFNMLDGIDGLVGTIVLISFSGLGVVSYISGLNDIQGICIGLVASTLAFLIFNIYGRVGRKSFSKAFMGDAGSMFLGLILAVLLMSATTMSSHASISAPGILWFVLLPITDMATTIYRRIKAGRSPLSPDRTHIHHILSRAGLNKYQVLFFLSIVQLGLVVVGIFTVIADMPDYFTYLLIVLFVCFYQYLIYRCWKMVRWMKKTMSLQNVVNRV